MILSKIYSMNVSTLLIIDKFPNLPLRSCKILFCIIPCENITHYVVFCNKKYIIWFQYFYTWTQQFNHFQLASITDREKSFGRDPEQLYIFIVRNQRMIIDLFKVDLYRIIFKRFIFQSIYIQTQKYIRSDDRY